MNGTRFGPRYHVGMLVYAGIDEAGYGPMLGPLCVASTVFVLRDPPADGRVPDLWNMLERMISRRLREARGRITVADSKKLKGARSAASHPLRHLERGVLVWMMARQTDHDLLEASTQDTLLARLGVTVPEHPWYAAPSTLPVTCDADQLRIDANRLRRELDATGIQCHSMSCEALGASDFNRHVDLMRNKANVNMRLVFRKIDDIWRQFENERPRIVVDRQGGRSSYRDELQIAWPESSIRVIAESSAFSRYEIQIADRGPLVVIFTARAEDDHLPVALASMTAKYVRELMMDRMNRFFQSRQPGLRDTAGYVEDARRYLQDLAEVLEQDRIDRRDLVRCC